MKILIIIGHSLGGVFTLRVLEQMRHAIKAVFLVGTPVGIKPIANYDRDSAFCGFEFDWDAIKNNTEHFTVYQSDNDPYVGLENGRELAKNVGVELSFIPSAGHFNQAAGYTEFEALLTEIKSVLNG